MDTELLVDTEFECGYGFSDLSLTIVLALKDTKIRRLEIKRKPVIITIKFYFIRENIHSSLLLTIFSKRISKKFHKSIYDFLII